MSEFLTTAQLRLVVIVVLGLVMLIVFFSSLARFYRRPAADEALVRTGQGGNQVAIGQGIMIVPILHQLMRVSLRSLKLSVERSGKNALVTRDKIKANVTTELFVKVSPNKEHVLDAARSFGDRSLDEHAIGELIEGKLTDALRSVAANQTFIELHAQRKQFAEHIQAALAEELSKNGLTLENVSITALAMVPVKDLDPHDVFDAEGLRAITESVQSNAEKTNQIQREKEIAIHLQNVEAKKRSLTMEQDQAQAEADQQRRVQEYRATQSAETAKAIYIQEQARELAAFEKQQAVEKARIAQEQGIAVAQAARVRAEREAQIAGEKAQQAAEIAKQREIEAAMIEKEKTVQAAEIDRQKSLEAATIEKQKVVEAAEIVKQQVIETARVAKQIAITQSEEQASRAAALKAQADAEQQQAMQGIITVEETAKANREKQIAIIKSEEAASQSRIAAEREAFKKKLEADTAAAAVKAQAEGEASAKKAQADGEIARAQGVARSQELQAQATAKVVQIQAQAEADRIRISAEAKAKAAQQEAEAMMSMAEALRRRGEAEAQAKQRMVEADNTVASKFLMRDIAIKALEVLPQVTHELMQPAKAISEIKVLQLQGGGSIMGGGDSASPNGLPMFGAASPILKTILEAGAAYPLLREMLSFAQVDTGKLADKVRTFVGTLPDEVKAAVDADPELASKLAEITRRVQDTTLEPMPRETGAAARSAESGA